MKNNLSVIFHKNMELIQSAQKAVFYFRRQEYTEALNYIVEAIDQITIVVEQVIEINAYFSEDICQRICELLSDILVAKKNKDYILLADVLESRLVPQCIKLQGIIHANEDITYYTVERYASNIRSIYGLMTRGCQDTKQLQSFRECLNEPMVTKELIEAGYRIEMTPSGVMTLAVTEKQVAYYMHSSHMPMYEAFLMAKSWYSENTDCYYVYGFGLGYHIQELCRLTGKDKKVIVYESDLQILKLACAFTSCLWMKSYENLVLIYDPQLENLKKSLQYTEAEISLKIHHPSFRNIREQKAKDYLADFLPYRSVLETC